MRIVIEGAGEVGSHLAKLLSNNGNEVTIIDSSEERMEGLASSADVVTIVGRTSSIRVLKSAGIDKADLFIAVNPSARQDMNIVSALLAKKLGCKRVCARINDEELLAFENRAMLSEMGIDLIFYPEKIAANEIVSSIVHSSASEAMDFARGRLVITAFKLEEDSPILDMKVAEFSAIASSDKLQFRVVAIARGNETMVPKFDTVFRYHDIVYIITKRDGMEPLGRYLGKTSLEVDDVMIMGGGSIGAMVAMGLAPHVHTVKIIERNLDRCRELIESTPGNVFVVNGDGKNSDLLEEEDIRKHEAFVAVTDSDEANVLACVAAKKLGVGKTVAKVENMEYIRIAEEIGVDLVINKKQLTAGKIFKMTLSSKLRLIKYMTGTNAEVLEYIVPEGSRITKGQLKDMDFPKNAVIGGLIRGNESQIAVGTTQIEPYDRVAVFTMPEAVKEVDKFFQ